MNEITLSKDINRIETEIQFYKEKAGESIWEIGRRLNHVKENDLAHGEFGKWLDKVKINQSTANKMMRVTRELPNSYTYTNLGLTALDLITALPEEEREKEHTLSSGEAKTPDEMTVRELKELKKEINALEDALKGKDKVIDDLKQREPEVIQKIIEVEKEVTHPHVDDLRSDNKQLSDALRNAKAEADAATKRSEFLEHEIKELYETRKEVDEKSRRYEELTEGIQRLEGKMNENQQMLASQKRVLDTIRGGNDLLDKLSGLIYATDIETLTGNELVHVELNKLMQRVEWWFNDLNKKIDSTTILEGEIIND